MLETTDDKATTRLRLMGPFRMTAAGGAVEIPSRRARAALSYIALAPDRSVTRERLCGLLWSDRGEAQARASLRQCLLELRAALAKIGLDLLTADRETVRLNTALDIDLDDVEAALKAETSDLSVLVAEIGDARLLEDLEIGGLFEDWRRAIADRLDRAIAGAVGARLRVLEREADWAGTLHLAESYLRRDSLDEMVAASAIRANIALGAAGAAQRQYQTLDAALTKDLGVRPGAAAREALAFAPNGASQPHGSKATTSVQATSPTLAAERQALPLPDRPSIAVLPFKNLSGDPEQEYFADAITEDIVAALSRWRWFFVIARDSSFTYKNRDVDVDRVGLELGVRYVLEGSVRKAGQRVRVSARLIDAFDGDHVWTDRFDRDLLDVLDLQDEITARVAASIEPAMLRGEGMRTARKKPTDFSALDYFYKAMWHLHNMTEDSDVEALSLFEEVIRRDPASPLGYVGRSRILYARAVFGASSTPAPDLVEARAAAETAIGLDPRDAQAYYARSAASIYLNDHGAALRDARRSVEINPNFALGHIRLGHILIFTGESSEAIEPIERGLRLSPYDPQLAINLNLLSLALYHTHQYDQSIVQARAAMHQGPDRHSLLLAASLARAGRLDEAREVFPPPGQRVASSHQPLAPRYLRSSDRDHLREGIRLARDANREMNPGPSEPPHRDMES